MYIKKDVSITGYDVNVSYIIHADTAFITRKKAQKEK